MRRLFKVSDMFSEHKGRIGQLATEVGDMRLIDFEDTSGIVVFDKSDVIEVKEINQSGDSHD